MTEPTEHLSTAPTIVNAHSQLKDAFDNALSHAQRRGADQSAVSGHFGIEHSFMARNGTVDLIERADTKSLGITVYCDQRSGSAQSNDLSPDAIERTVDAALAIARHTEADPAAGLADATDLATDPIDLDLDHPWDLAENHANELIATAHEAALSADTRVTQTDRLSVATHRGVSGYANSNGFSATVPSSMHSLSCIAIATENDAMERDYWHDSARRFEDLMSADEIGRRAGIRTGQRLSARKAPTGPVPVLFDAPVAKSIIGHIIGAASGSQLYRKASFLLDAVGEQILPTRFSIREEPRRPRGHASAWFDGDGVATRDSAFVADGVLERYALSTYSGRRLGLASTGNAGGLRNIVVSHDESDLAALLKDMGRGILVTELMGFGVNLVNGDYSRGASGFWVEEGTITYPVNEFTVAGNLRDMLKNIRSIGADIDPRGNLACGSILFDRLTVAGS